MTRLLCLHITLIFICLPQVGSAQDSFSVVLEVDSANINFDQFIEFENKYYIATNYFNKDFEVKSALVEYDQLNQTTTSVLYLDSINFGPDPMFIMCDSLFYIFGRDRSVKKDLRYYKISSQFKIEKKFKIETTGEINYSSGTKSMNKSAYLHSSIDSLDNRYTLITKINSDGNINWSDYFFKNDFYSFIVEIQEFVNNTIVFSAGITKPEFSTQRRAQLTQIDTSGNILWEYIPDEPMSGGAVPPWFAVLSDSTIVMNYSISKSLSDPEDWNVKLYKFVWIDRDGRYIKERYIPHHYRVDAYIADVKAGKQGDYFFTIGSEEDVRDPYLSQAVLTKYNNTGDTLWHRSYTHPDFPAEDFWYSLVEMEEREDGSFVLLVKISTGFDYNKAWLFTVDSNGCFYTDSCGERLVSSTVVDLPDQENTAILFPNPGGDQVTIQSSKAFDQVVFYDLSGRIKSTHQMESTKNISLPINDLPPGMYMLQFLDEGHFVDRLKLVKQ